MKRVVMCKNDWPEPDQEDFSVFEVRPEETDEQAIQRAQQAYSPEDEFYILERQP